jgi:hypothetical protein
MRRGFLPYFSLSLAPILHVRVDMVSTVTGEGAVVMPKEDANSFSNAREEVIRSPEGHKIGEQCQADASKMSNYAWDHMKGFMDYMRGAGPGGAMDQTFGKPGGLGPGELGDLRGLQRFADCFNPKIDAAVEQKYGIKVPAEVKKQRDLNK